MAKQKVKVYPFAFYCSLLLENNVGYITWKIDVYVLQSIRHYLFVSWLLGLVKNFGS